MQRRDFTKNLLSGLPLLAAPKLADLDFQMKKNEAARPKKLQKSPRLESGMTARLIAPAGPATAEKIEKAVANLRSLGLEVQKSKHLAGKTGFLSGSDDERLEDFHDAFRDKKVDAVWCVRGGYGTTRLLEKIDFDLIRRRPKLFFGYSDITALHTAIHQRTGLVTFHGPVGASDFTDFTGAALRKVAVSPTPRFEIKLPDAIQDFPHEVFRPEILRKGVARGRLIGGNLCLLASLVGTFWEPDFRGKIVFIEEIDEKPYRCDRMLTQLLTATNLRKAAGVALGVFLGCEKGEKDDSWSLREVLRDRLANLGVPVVYGLPFGHISDQVTLPVGIEAELDADRGLLTLLETAVV